MEYFRMIMALIGVLALVFLIFWLMKKFNARVALSDSKHLKIIERVNLGPDKMLLLVSVCGKCMVLGVTSQRAEKICDVDLSEEEISAQTAGKAQSFPTFAESFKAVLGKKKIENSVAENAENDEKNGFENETDNSEK